MSVTKNARDFTFRCVLFSILVFSGLLLSVVSELQYFSQSDPSFLSPSSRFIVILVDDFGLSNRLRFIADWYIIAKQSKRKLVINWLPTNQCNIEFAGLFSNIPKNIWILKDPVPKADAGVAAICALAASRNSSCDGITFNRQHELWSNSSVMHENFIVSKKVVDGDNDKRVIVHGYSALAALLDTPCEYYMIKRSEFYSSLEPVKHIKDAVDDVMSTFFTGYIPVAVHMRIHHPGFDWAVIPPLGDSRQALEFGETAQLNHFRDLMMIIQKKFSSPYSNDDNSDSSSINNTAANGSNSKSSSIRFFISSNSNEEKSKLLSFFPTAISLQTADSDGGGGDSRDKTSFSERNTPGGVEIALIEWLLISRCALVIHTFGSTFALEASQRDLNTDIVSIREGGLILGRSLSQPFCGSASFARAYSPSATLNTWTELEGRREINGAAISYHYCDALKHWGISSNLLCINSS